MSAATLSRSQGRGIKATSKLLGVEVVAYALGRAHARLPRWVVVTMIVFGTLFVAGIAFAHVVIYPGALLLVAFAYGIRPLRAVAVAENSVVVMSKSAWNGKHSVLGVFPLEILRPIEEPSSGARMKLAVGPDVVTLRRKDFDRLLAAAQSAGATRPRPFMSGVVAPPPSAAPAGWYPDPSSPPALAKLRYWDGTTWTSVETG